MADKKPENDEQRDEPNPWERFRVFISRVAAVPKEEAHEKRREYEWEQKKRAD